MATTIKTTFQLRRGNAEVWAKNNPVLAAGEPGFELDTGKLKIGNGSDAYNDLPYLSADDVAALLEGKVSKAGDTMTGMLGVNLSAYPGSGGIVFGVNAPSEPAVLEPSITGESGVNNTITLLAKNVSISHLTGDDDAVARVEFNETENLIQNGLTFINSERLKKGTVFETDDGVALSAEDGACLKVGKNAVTVCDNTGGTSQIKGVKTGTENTDAVNVKQLRDAGSVFVKKTGDTMTGQLSMNEGQQIVLFSRGGGGATVIRGTSIRQDRAVTLLGGETGKGTALEVWPDYVQLHKEGNISAAVPLKGVATPTEANYAANKEYVDSRLFTFTITPTNGPGSQMLSATRAEMLAALDAGKTLLGYWTETRTILGTTDTIKHEFRLESVSGTGADRGLVFVNYEQFYKSTLYVNGNDTVSFVNKEQVPNPMTKTEAMTQSVGMDNDGRLWTEPGASGLPEGATANQQLVTNSDGNVVWENRPGGYDVATITNTDTRTLTFKATETAGDYKADVNMWNGVNNNGTFPLGMVYDVTFNGVKYRDMQPIQIEGRNGGYLGDPALVAYPFYIGGDSEFMGSGIYLYYVHANVGGTIEVTIETHGTKTVKIPRDYVETPNCVVTDLSSDYWGASIYDEKDNSYLLSRRVDGETWLRTNADHFYIDSQQPIISNGAPMRFQSYNGSSMVSEKYGLELGNGYIVLASSTAGSTKKFRITVDDSGTLTATEITTT